MLDVPLPEGLSRESAGIFGLRNCSIVLVAACLAAAVHMMKTSTVAAYSASWDCFPPYLSLKVCTVKLGYKAVNWVFARSVTGSINE